MSLHPLAGKPVPPSLLANIPKLVSLYYTNHPDVSQAEQRVAFGTSGHRGTPRNGSFNEDHILAVCQAICDYRKEIG
jgi:phosphoglucomutase